MAQILDMLFIYHCSSLNELICMKLSKILLHCMTAESLADNLLSHYERNENKGQTVTEFSS